MNQITFVGHATVLIELDGVRLLTDPLLTPRVSHLLRTAPVPELDAPRLDAVLLSHLHVDHLHLRSMRRLGKDHLIVAPRGAAGFLARHGFNRVIEIVVGEKVRLGGIDIEAVPADHPPRPLPGRPKTDCLGYVIHGSRHIYFAGDTDLFAGMAEIGPALDVALLPVWGWGPTLGEGHMDPPRAVEALALLRPKVVMPIHWGTLYPVAAKRWRPRPLLEPPHAFARVAAQMAPDVDVRVVPPGGALVAEDGGVRVEDPV